MSAVSPSISAFLFVSISGFSPSVIGKNSLWKRSPCLVSCSNSVVIFSALQDTVSVHRPSFYAERFQRFMCNTVFKKIPCKWILPDDPPVAPLPQEMRGRTPMSGSCQGLRPLLLCPRPVRAASRPCVSHSVCPSRFRVAAFPLALPTCGAEVRASSG